LNISYGVNEQKPVSFREELGRLIGGLHFKAEKEGFRGGGQGIGIPGGLEGFPGAFGGL